jgi:dTDP-4-dehydrorhamnose reductase
MKVYLTGGNGYVGKELVKRGYRALACDVTNYNFVNIEIASAKPDLVIHLAGKSDPDYCKEYYKESCAVNFNGTRNVMEVCFDNKIPAVFLSSSQVWGGGWQEGFNKHSENSKSSVPINEYGLQKLTAENAVLVFGMKIIRTSHIFDKSRLAPRLSDFANGRPVDAPTFLKRSFIHLQDFAYQIEKYLAHFDDMPSVLHLAGSKTVSYCDFWLEVCDQFGFNSNLVKGRRTEKNSPNLAKRPHNGGLNTDLSRKLGFPEFDYIGGIGRMRGES